MTDRIKTCPICEFTQVMEDPTRHVCAKVLRKNLMDARDQLNKIRVLVDNDDPVAGVRLLKVEHDAIPSIVAANRIAGIRHGRADAIKILDRSISMAPLWKRILLLGQRKLLGTLGAHPDDKRRVIQGEA